jgi:hypothetical protein
MLLLLSWILPGPLLGDTKFATTTILKRQSSHQAPGRLLQGLAWLTSAIEKELGVVIQNYSHIRAAVVTKLPQGHPLLPAHRPRKRRGRNLPASSLPSSSDQSLVFVM